MEVDAVQVIVAVDPLSVAITEVGGSGSLRVVAVAVSEYEESVVDAEVPVT